MAWTNRYGEVVSLANRQKELLSSFDLPHSPLPRAAAGRRDGKAVAAAHLRAALP